MPIFTLRLKSMPSTNSTKPCTKCCRDCSPSVTMSRPASSCALSHRSVASRFASSSCLPVARHAGHSFCGSASHAGFGRLPAIVVFSIRLLWPFMLWVRVATFALLAAGCAVPPPRPERERALRAAIDPCLKQYPAVRLSGIDDYGQVYARAPEHTDVEGFERCSKEAIQRAHLALIGSGKLADAAAPATVAIKQAYSA